MDLLGECVAPASTSGWSKAGQRRRRTSRAGGGGGGVEGQAGAGGGGGFCPEDTAPGQNYLHEYFFAAHTYFLKNLLGTFLMKCVLFYWNAQMGKLLS